MPQYNPQQDNQVFLSQIGFLALIGLKGPHRALHFEEVINNVKVIDNPANIIPGDLAYSGNKKGIVTAVVNAGGVIKVTAKYGPLDRPAGVTAEEWSANFATLAFQTIEHDIKGDGNNANENHIVNPWLVLANVGALFARPVDVIHNQAEQDDIVLQTQNISIVQGEGNTVLKFNIPGVSVQKKVGGVNSGAVVFANGSGIASIPNGQNAGDVVTFLVTKADYSNQTFGPYTVKAPITLLAIYSKDGAADNTIVGVQPIRIQDDNWFIRLSISVDSISFVYSNATSGVNNVAGSAFSNPTAGKVVGNSLTITAKKAGYADKVFGPYVFVA